MAVPDDQALAVFAAAIVKEVPAAHLVDALTVLGPGSVSFGDACGNGCGGGCGGGCGRTIDIYGHTELTQAQRVSVLQNRDALRSQIVKTLEAVEGQLR